MRVNRVVGSAALGALIGGVAIYLLNPQNGFWILGSLLGGLLSFIACDPGQFFEGCEQAYVFVFKTYRPRRRLSRLERIERRTTWLSAVSCVISICFWVVPVAGTESFILTSFLNVHDAAQRIILATGPSIFVSSIMLIFFLTVMPYCFATTTHGSREEDQRETGEKLKRQVRKNLDLLKKWNIISAPITLVSIIASFAIRFIAAVYRFTVSDERIIATVGGSFGATLSYFTEHNVLYGAIAGGGLAFLLTLLSKKDLFYPNK